jgi:large subunit ribosomal protein L19e
MVKIRGLRNLLKTIRKQGSLDKKTFRELYQKAKGNFFRNKRHILLYIEQNNLLSKTEEAPKKETSKKVESKK